MIFELALGIIAGGLLEGVPQNFLYFATGQKSCGTSHKFFVFFCSDITRSQQSDDNDYPIKVFTLHVKYGHPMIIALRSSEVLLKE